MLMRFVSRLISFFFAMKTKSMKIKNYSPKGSQSSKIKEEDKTYDGGTLDTVTVSTGPVNNL